MRKSITLLLLLLSAVVFSQIEEPVHWSLSVQSDSVLVMTARIDEGWHLYDTQLPDDGPLPTVFYAGDRQIMPVNIGEPPVRIFDEMFQMELSYFEKEASFSLVSSEINSGEQLSVRYMACNNQSCLAPTTYVFDLPQSPANGSGAHSQANGSGAQFQANGSGAQASTASADGHSLLWIFLMGLLGGLLAIFTPCVWPIIPMTVSFFLKRTDKGAMNVILYGLSIIILYVGLGLLISAVFGASALNDISTNAIVNIFFFLLLVVFALSFFGLFEITLPDSWSTALDNKARTTGGFLSILLMAFTLVIVSFSCTGPIIGTLLVEAAGKSLLAPALGMLGFAIALALPFSLFAMFPQWMRQAPRSGDWMTSFKVVLAFLELALSLKFLSVADMAYGWGILPRWLFLLVWIACFLGIGVYLLWNIRTVSMVRKIIRAVVIIPSVAFAIYLVPGLWGAPVKAVSAFAPPMEIEGREVFHDYDEGMAYARQTGKPVVIDFTGYGCVNCRKMEAYVLDNDSVKARLQNYVFIELFVDDKRDGIGERNSRLQREHFGANAQPYFVQLDSKGTPVADPMVFTTDPMEFVGWLKY